LSAARSAGAPAMLPFTLSLRANLDLRAGAIAAAYAAAAESVQLAAETGLRVEASFALVRLGRAEAILGRDEDCRAHTAAALESSRRAGANSIEMFASAALGLLELSRGAVDRAAVHLAECRRLEERCGDNLPTLHLCAADHIEALARTGARAEAE